MEKLAKKYLYILGIISARSGGILFTTGNILGSRRMSLVLENLDLLALLYKFGTKSKL